MNKPIITIIIATFNSGKLLPRVLAAIKKQTFLSKDIEVLFIDGGSTDDTRKVAKQYKCRVIDNPKTEPVYAKYLGYLQAKGRYIMYLDHDEVMENKNSLQLKYEIFKANKNVHCVIGSGYKSPANSHYINKYINEFGDPFSFFIYRLSKDARYFIDTMKKRYPMIVEYENSVVFDLSNVKILPIIELCAIGSMIDGEYMKKYFPATLKKPELIPHFFYLLNSGSTFLGITKNDALVHYSSDTLKKYLVKIKWRIKNNIYHKSNMGRSGFSGREEYQPFQLRFKKYLYIPYVYTMVCCLFDSLYLAFTRRDIVYLIHLPLSIYTANLILYHTFLKLMGHRPLLKSYDEKKVIG